MKCAVLAVLAVAATAGKESPVQKLLGLLEDMKKQSEDELHKDEVKCAKISTEREVSLEETARQIAKNEDKAKVLEGEIAQAKATIEELDGEIQELDALIDRSEKDMTAAQAIRDIEHSQYQAELTDYDDTIAAIKDAIHELNGVYNPEMLVQLKNKIKVQKARDMVVRMASEQPDPNSFNHDAMKPVIDMLEKLQRQMEDEKFDLDKKEKDSQSAFQILKNELERTIANSQEHVTTKTNTVSDARASKAQAESDLTDTEETLKRDKQFHSELSAVKRNDDENCERRHALFEEEQQALSKAIEIIKEMSTAMMFVQLRELALRPSQSRVAEYLKKRGNAIHSTLLTQLATAAQAPDAFAKIKKMIQDLIVKLEEEATEESTHQGWCDTELATNKQTREDKTDAVIKGSAAMDQLNANIEDNMSTIESLEEALTQLSKDRAEATETRQEERKNNKEIIKTADEDLELLAKARTVLEEFYGKQVEAGQGNVGNVETSFDDVESARNTSGGQGVIEIIQSIESDTEKLRSETSSDEATQQKEFEDFMNGSEIDITQKKTVLQNTKTKLSENQANLASTAKDLKDDQKSLDDANRTYDKLKPSCVDAGTSFEERTARRKEEIESLQEALKILSGDADF